MTVMAFAWPCYDALGEARRRCPEDVSVTGYNDMPFADRFNPPLTTVRIPDDEIGVQAGLLLLRKMRDPQAAIASVNLEPTLMIRGSTAKPATKDESFTGTNKLSIGGFAAITS